MKGAGKAVMAVVVMMIVLTSNLVWAQDPVKYSFGVVPQTTATEIFKTWNPLLKKLSSEMGVSLELRLFDNIPKFESSFLAGELDFAYMNPYHVVMAQKAGYIPLVRDNDPVIGILVVKKGGDIRAVRDLDGKTIAFPAPNAFAASLYMRALLKEQMKINITPHYMGNHSNAYRAVDTGAMSVKAGGGVRKTLNKENDALKNNLLVLYETPAAAPHPVTANKRVPESVRKRFMEAFTKVAGAEKDLVAAIQMTNPVPADYKRDYEPLRDLGLERYAVSSEN